MDADKQKQYIQTLENLQHDLSKCLEHVENELSMSEHDCDISIFISILEQMLNKLKNAK